MVFLLTLSFKVARIKSMTINQSKELLDSQKILSAIKPENLPHLSKLEVFSSLSSTNTYLLERAKTHAPSGWVCLAEEQTQGRGRRGREWFSPYGENIYCSLLWRFVGVEQSMSGLSLAVAVMVAHVLKKYGIEEGIQLKWPNDILFDNRKLAGILLEKSGENIVMGVGLNLFLPENTDDKRIDIATITDKPVSRNYFAGLLLNELLEKLPVYETYGLNAFIEAWRQYDFLTGKNITVHTPEKIFPGVMLGVDERGELLLQPEKGAVQRFSYGEVSVRYD